MKVETVLGFVVGAGLLLAPSQQAQAMDYPITGRIFAFSDQTTPTKRKIKWVSKRKSTEVGNPIVVGARGGVADPTIHGGSFVVKNTAINSEAMTIALPAGNWSALPADPTKPIKGYRYMENLPPSLKIVAILKSTSSGAVVKVRVTDKTGDRLTYTLNEVFQVSMGAILETGADRHCVDFGGIVKRDLAGEFIHINAPAPPVCP